MYTKRNLVSAILAVGMLLAVANVAHAATEAEKQAAIDAGLAYLAGIQQGDGHWENGGTDYDIAATGAALLAFIEEGHTPGSGTAYSANVANGLNYLFLYAQNVTIVPQTAGNPDTNGNGIGVKFNYTASINSRDIYCTGLALCPIAAVGTPGAIVGAGPQAGRTYADVIQDTVDYFSYAQSEGGWPRGGWRYWANYGSSDNSTSQWPVVGLLYAQSAGATVPAFVASELAFWVAYIQNPADGGSWYDNRRSGSLGISNVSRTGTLLLQQVFAGAGAGTAAAQNYLNSQWLTGPSGTWNGNFGHPYAMWAAYKGLEVTIGLDADQSVISNLHADPGDVDNPNHGWNWWEDYCEWLVNNQLGGGSWSGYSYWSGTLATAWYINILAATEIPLESLEKEITSGPDVDEDGEIDVVVEVGQSQPTLYDFTITQSGLAGLLIVDTVPAEWNVLSAESDNTDDQVDVFPAGRGNPSKSATKIEWRPASVSSSLLVWVETRQSPGKKNVKFAPTSCGVLYLNEDGAEAFEVDENGEPLRDPETGEKLPPILVSNPLCLAAVGDCNGDGVIARDGSGDEDGDGLTDFAEACLLGTDPCNPDTDGDGVLDGVDPDPLDPAVP